jgi:citrate lyase beta subunit
MSPDERQELLALVTTAVESVVVNNRLSPDEIHWVRMAIQAEAERASLRKAIIEKSLAGLMWVAIVAAGGWLVDFVTSHWR